jgi:hypothetical protein
MTGGEQERESTLTAHEEQPPVEEPQKKVHSALLLTHGHLHVLVHRGAKPVFLRSFAVPIDDVQQLNGKSSSELFLASASPIETARREFQRSFDMPWPEPTRLFPDIRESEADREVLEKLALRFAERLQLQVTWAVQERHQEMREGSDPRPGEIVTADEARGTKASHAELSEAALSLLRVGSTSETNLLAREDVRRGFRHEKARTLLAGALTLVAVLTVGGLWAAGDLHRMEKRLEVLESTLAQDREGWQDLAAMRRELTQTSMRDARALAALQALYSTFKSGVSGLHLVQFTYDKNQGISLKGHAPQVATITRFAEKLAESEGWKDVKVLSIHQTARTNDGSFQFEIQAQWAYAGGTSQAGP